MLQLTAIEAGYRNLTVLRGIDLEVRAGEIVALIGPNGAEGPPGRGRIDRRR